MICGRYGGVDKNDSTSFLHLQADIDRFFYFKRSVGGRGFMNVEDSVE